MLKLVRLKNNAKCMINHAGMCRLQRNIFICLLSTVPPKCKSWDAKNKKKIMKEVKAWTLSLYACISKASNLAVI